MLVWNDLLLMKKLNKIDFIVEIGRKRDRTVEVAVAAGNGLLVAENGRVCRWGLAGWFSVRSYGIQHEMLIETDKVDKRRSRWIN